MNIAKSQIADQFRHFYWKISDNIKSSPLNELGITIGTSLLVGIGAGLGAVVFRLMIEFFQSVSFDKFGQLLAPIKPFHLLIIPAIGGLIFGPLIYFFAREAKGHGVPEVMEAVALRGGRIRPQVALVKVLASSICIGTGGSIGREGPIAQIGATLGSSIGQILKLSDDRVRTLVACGAGAGIAATFNAPIGGAIFAIEVILGHIKPVSFSAVVISSVTASVVAQAIQGDARAFTVPQYVLISPWELFFYAILGILMAVSAIGFTRLLYYSEDQWDKIPMPEYLKPVLGGVALGIIGILTFNLNGFPRVFGVGYDLITSALFGEFTFKIAVILFFAKILATVTTLGSGGSGGVFAPSLFMGAMLGSSFGHIVNLVFPSISAPAGAYALVGMAAFFSGAARAPITAILILFEMTGDYHIILPLMLTTVVSTFVSQIISKDTIYTLKLTRRGVFLEQNQDIDVMQGVTVDEVMTRDFEKISMDMPLPALADLFVKSHRHGFPVVNNEGILMGLVTIGDLDKRILDGDIKKSIVADIATTQGLLVAYPDEPMWKALYRMSSNNIGRLPVVEKEGSRKMVGVIRRENIIKAYDRAITKKAKMQQSTETLRLGKLDDAGFININIPANSRVIGKRVSEIKLPGHCVIVSLRRGRKLNVVNGYTILKNGDQLTIFAEESCVDQVQKSLIESKDLAEHTGNYDAIHKEITINAGASCVGKLIKELPLPHETIIVSIHRGNDIIIPHGDTDLQTGDIVELFGLENDTIKAEEILK